MVTTTIDLKIDVSKTAVSDVNEQSVQYASLSCTLNDYSHDEGSKDKVDVSTFCSTKKEYVAGLRDAGEISVSGNFVKSDEGIAVLRDSFKKNTVHLFRIVFNDGTGFLVLGEVMSISVSAAIGEVVKADFKIDMRSELEDYTAE